MALTLRNPRRHSYVPEDFEEGLELQLAMEKMRTAGVLNGHVALAHALTQQYTPFVRRDL
jgi:hypothetical protein